DAALDRLLERAVFGADQVAARADDEVGVELLLRRHRGLVLERRLFLGDAAAPAGRPGALGESLVLEVQPGSAGADVALHRVIDVNRIAVARIAVDEDGDVAAGGASL